MAEIGPFWSQAKVTEQTSLSRTTIYDLVKAGEFPKPVRLTRNRIAWEASKVQAWLTERVHSSRGEAA
jgi:prophage regulatory protein